MAALTELEVHNLPIRSPKMTVLMKALTNLERQLCDQKVKEPAQNTEDGGKNAKPNTSVL